MYIGIVFLESIEWQSRLRDVGILQYMMYFGDTEVALRKSDCYWDCLYEEKLL